MKKTVTVEEACHLWQEKIHGSTREKRTISIEEAYGQVLAEPLVAKLDIPSFSKSAVDGYALIWEEGRKSYQVLGTIGAGTVWDVAVQTGEAVRIMTGAPIPTSCNTVIMQEACEISTEGMVSIKGVHKVGENIIHQGEECAMGTPILDAGILIGAEEMGTMVSLGYEKITVFEPLRAVLLTSGREIIEPREALTVGKVYNSNRFLFQNLLKQEGVADIVHYHVSDDPNLLDEEVKHIEKLVQDADIVLSTGGVSVGLFDTLPIIYERLGATILYNRIDMRPGAASMGAIRTRNDGKLQYIFGLSGNPAAAYQNWLLIARPMIKKLQGMANSDTFEIIECEIEETLAKKNPVDRYVQGEVHYVEGKAFFKPNQHMSGSAQLGLHQMNALLKLPRGTEGVRAGEKVKVYRVK